MSQPLSVKLALSNVPPEFQAVYMREFSKKKKSLLIAYLAWALFGWHYLYLGRVGMQFAFWFTLGFLVIGWLIDGLRLPFMVARVNDDIARDLIVQIKMMAA